MERLLVTRYNFVFHGAYIPFITFPASIFNLLERVNSSRPRGREVAEVIKETFSLQHFSLDDSLFKLDGANCRHLTTGATDVVNEIIMIHKLSSLKPCANVTWVYIGRYLLTLTPSFQIVEERTFPPPRTSGKTVRVYLITKYIRSSKKRAPETGVSLPKKE